MKAILFANGALPISEIDIEPGSIIFAADGGARHCLKLGIVPDAVIGDFDSLSETEITNLETSGSVLLRYPEDKNETDLELALNYAMDVGATVVTCYGLLGGRWDMSFANILILASPRYQGIRFQIIDTYTDIYLLRGGETLNLEGKPGETVSVIPLGTGIHGVTYQGMTWPLKKASLDFGSTRGVSNRLSGPSAQIHLDSGVILIFHFSRSTGDQG